MFYFLPYQWLLQTLLASGGHCLLLYAQGLGNYHLLGSGLDDAPGEAFDKVARMLGINGGYVEWQA
eukprot:m.85780 g.85780  ORF g.85780 m.85780 type:complete len:66 (+) comp13023_c0_seq3:645-842(+)